MPLHVALNHRTSYRYDRAIALGPQTVRLRPAPHARTPIVSYALKIEPKPHFLNWQQDPHGNYLARAGLPRADARISRSRSTWSPTWRSINPFDFFLEPRRRDASRSPTTRSLAQELAPYLEARAGPGRCWRPSSPRSPRRSSRTVDFLVGLNQRLQQRHRLRRSAWSPACRRRRRRWHRPAARAATRAWLLVQVLRHLGLAARFVSGYLIQLGADRSRSTARRAPRSTSPTCTPGPRSTCPAPAGSGSTRPRACSPARATSRSPARPSPSRRADHRRSSDEVPRSSSSFDMAVHAASTRRRASPSPTPRRSGRRSWRSATRSTRALPPATCA